MTLNISATGLILRPSARAPIKGATGARAIETLAPSNSKVYGGRGDDANCSKLGSCFVATRPNEFVLGHIEVIKQYLQVSAI